MWPHEPLRNPWWNADGPHRDHSCCELISTTTMSCPENCFTAFSPSCGTYIRSTPSWVRLELWREWHRCPIWDPAQDGRVLSTFWSVMSLCVKLLVTTQRSFSDQDWEHHSSIVNKYSEGSLTAWPQNSLNRFPSRKPDQVYSTKCEFLLCSGSKIQSENGWLLTLITFILLLQKWSTLSWQAP